MVLRVNSTVNSALSLPPARAPPEHRCDQRGSSHTAASACAGSPSPRGGQSGGPPQGQARVSKVLVILAVGPRAQRQQETRTLKNLHQRYAHSCRDGSNFWVVFCTASVDCFGWYEHFDDGNSSSP